jgi:hypothetical protein
VASIATSPPVARASARCRPFLEATGCSALRRNAAKMLGEEGSLGAVSLDACPTQAKDFLLSRSGSTAKSGKKRSSAWTGTRRRAPRLSTPFERSRVEKWLSTCGGAKQTERMGRNSPAARSSTCRSGGKVHPNHPSVSCSSWLETQMEASCGTSSPSESATPRTRPRALSMSARTTDCTVAIRHELTVPEEQMTSAQRS